MPHRILVTIGPSSFSKDIVQQCSKEDIYVYRINLSHTRLDKVEQTIAQLQEWTDVPICLDSEGAQVRNQKMVSEDVMYSLGDTIRIHFEEVVGDSENISFTPSGVAQDFVVGDLIRVDFNSATFRVIEKKKDHCLAQVEQGGVVGSNKATDLDRQLELASITEKDKKAIAIGRKMGLKYFALSFASCAQDIDLMRRITGDKSVIISKVESVSGLLNLDEIISCSDQILIDRGDLSRQIPIEKIPFLQRRIISTSRAMDTPVYVATNLLESMVTTQNPSRAELNDVVSTLLMGANGLVLAAETAVGKYPGEAVQMARKLIRQAQRWTPNSCISDILSI